MKHKYPHVSSMSVCFLFILFSFGAIPPLLSLLLSAVVYGLIIIDIYNTPYFLLWNSNAGSPTDLLLTYGCNVLLCYRKRSALKNFPSLIHVG